MNLHLFVWHFPFKGRCKRNGSWPPVVTPGSMILREDWLPSVSYCGEIDSPQYDTALSRKTFSQCLRQARIMKKKKKGRKSRWAVPLNRIWKSHMTPRMILWRDWLPAVWYCGEIDSAQYHTAGRLTLRSMILRGDLEKFKYLSENLSKIENSLTHWPEAQAGSNEGREVENLVGLSL